ncbi:FtsK/SpoIIIE domain-containing protein [Devriesea agamarum]|uniref:FtsK/SpoIIIE domain-containing protein n=1 Tax=Devriesea agamarum TaxID=472569 RepID=UPI00071DBAE6|nr:FtsK/SpoIIIE domain-containing protein [Devriesea agamarum]
MRISLTLRRPDGSLTDLEVTADATVTVADLATSLFLADPMRKSARLPDGLTIQVQDAGAHHSMQLRTLNPEDDLMAAQLRSGAVIATTHSGHGMLPGPQKKAETCALLRVIDGPDKGREFYLPAGVSIVGQGSDCDIKLNDPMLAMQHFRVDIAHAIEISDLQSEYGISIGGRATRHATLSPSDIVVVADTSLSVTALKKPIRGTSESLTVEFNRAPRIVPRCPDTSIKAPSPPTRPTPQAFPYLIMIAPLLLGVAMFAVTRSVYSIMFIAMMPLMAVATYVQGKMQAAKIFKEQTRQFREGMQSVRCKLNDAHDIERAVRLAEAPSAADAVDAIYRRGSLLWTHRPEHRAFGTVRLGIGTDSSRVRLELPAEHDTMPQFRDELESLAEEYAVITGVPVIADLRWCGGVGLAGAGEDADGIARGIVSQLIGLHSPAELALAVMASFRTKEQWEWLKWVPHTCSPHSPLAGDHLAQNAGEAASLLAQLEDLIQRRHGEHPATGHVARTADMESGSTPNDSWSSQHASSSACVPVIPAVVLIVDDDAPAQRAHLVWIAEHGPKVGVYVLWRAGGVAALPAACRTYLDIDGSGSATAGHVQGGERFSPVTCDTVDQQVAHGIGRYLAPVTDAGVPVRDESDLPTVLSFLALTDHDLLRNPQTIMKTWARQESSMSPDPRAVSSPSGALGLEALVGHSGLEPLSLDLRRDGPHALVGGTTGSGKSEFLQTWVLAMAAGHSPDRVCFLFVDYKGGAAFADCVNLPHAVGLVTDLSAHLVHRVLDSLRAELRLRERLFHRKKVKDLASLERRGDSECPPSLVIVVDEFATLVHDIPEFIDGVVDIAARGRSLGVHLILATQRPAGVIKENLRANTNLRIALRMADEDDSKDIVGEPIAAHFDPTIPGRAVVKKGPGHLVMFQSGYVGGWTADQPGPAQIQIVEKNFATGPAWQLPKPCESAQNQGPEDVIRIVHALRQAAGIAGVSPPRRPWLAELAEHYDLAKLAHTGGDDDLVLGISDVPDQQRQPILGYKPDRDGNLAIYGASGAGKSTTLRSIALSAAIALRQGPVQIYGLDFAGSSLTMLEALPQVGSVISGEDEERVIRLLRRMHALVDERTKEFASVHAGTIAEYRQITSRSKTPRMFLLVDGIGNFRETYDCGELSNWFSTFMHIAANGRSVGVHVIVTADRPAAMPGALGASIQRRLIHRMAAADDYRSLGERTDLLAMSSPPGRCIADGYEAQIALLGGGTNLCDQARAIDQCADAMTRAGADRAPPIERMPARIPVTSLSQSVCGLPTLGLGDETLSEVGFTPRGSFMVAGPAGSGRSQAMLTMAVALRLQLPAVRLVHISLRITQLSNHPVWDLDISTLAEAQTVLSDLLHRLDSGSVPEGSLAVFIEEVTESSEAGLDNAMAALARLAQRTGQFVVGEGESATWSRAYTVAQPFKASRCGLILQPSDMDGEMLLGTSTGHSRRTVFPPGRGFLISSGSAVSLQVALAE